jgi:hypothetical protein
MRCRAPERYFIPSNTIYALIFVQASHLKKGFGELRDLAKRSEDFAFEERLLDLAADSLGKLDT